LTLSHRSPHTGAGALRRREACRQAMKSFTPSRGLGYSFAVLTARSFAPVCGEPLLERGSPCLTSPAAHCSLPVWLFPLRPWWSARHGDVQQRF